MHVSSTYASIHFHVVFATKCRQPIIDKSWSDRLHAYLGGVSKQLGAVPLEVGGVEDHVHLLLGLKPIDAIAPIVRELKKATNKWIREEMKLTEFSWQEGYAAFSESAARIPQLRAYIQGQEEHHCHVNSREELLQLLREAGVEPDMRFFE